MIAQSLKTIAVIAGSLAVIAVSLALLLALITDIAGSEPNVIDYPEAPSPTVQTYKWLAYPTAQPANDPLAPPDYSKDVQEYWEERQEEHQEQWEDAEDGIPAYPTGP